MSVDSQRCVIRGYCSNGWGLSSFIGKDCKEYDVAVAGGIFGEIVGIEGVCKERVDLIRRRAHAGIVEKASPYRTVPKCPYFLRCGGCAFQHVVYQEQLRIKQKIVTDLFAPLASSKTLFESILGSDDSYSYRNKMEFSFSQDKKGSRFLGLYSCTASSRVVDLGACSLTREWMSDVLNAVRTFWSKTKLLAYNSYKNTGSLLTLTLREGQTSKDRMVILTVSSNPDYALSKDDLYGFVESVKESMPCLPASLSIVLRIRQIAPGRPTQYYEMILYGPDFIREILTVEIQPCRKVSLEFQISSQSFFQPNTQQAMKIYSSALQMAELKSSDTVFDLYCGIGIFGMFAAQIAAMSYGIELSADSAYDAKTNSERLNIGNFCIKTGDVSSVIESLQIKEMSGSTIIVDPPRAGLMDKAIGQIERLNANRIVYVSCNPKSQAADVAKFVQKGWQIQRILPVDQFPQTPHVENIVSLCRS
jgi:23S rRNA (uracil1939-C5)-methyltransferase